MPACRRTSLTPTAPRRYAYHAGGGSCGMVLALDDDRTVVLLNNVMAPDLIGVAFEVFEAMD